MAKHLIYIEFDDQDESVQFKIDAVMDKFGAGLSTFIINDSDCLRTYKQLLTFLNSIHKAAISKGEVPIK